MRKYIWGQPLTQGVNCLGIKAIYLVTDISSTYQKY